MIRVTVIFRLGAGAAGGDAAGIHPYGGLVGVCIRFVTTFPYLPCRLSMPRAQVSVEKVYV